MVKINNLGISSSVFLLSDNCFHVFLLQYFDFYRFTIILQFESNSLYPIILIYFLGIKRLESFALRYSIFKYIKIFAASIYSFTLILAKSFDFCSILFGNFYICVHILRYFKVKIIAELNMLGIYFLQFRIKRDCIPPSRPCRLKRVSFS